MAKNWVLMGTGIPAIHPRWECEEIPIEWEINAFSMGSNQAFLPDLDE